MPNIGPFELLILVVFAVGFGWATGALARSKGYNFAVFAVLGAIFAPIPLLIAAVLPRRGGSGSPSANAPTFHT